MPRKSRGQLSKAEPRRTIGSDEVHDREIANLGAALYAAWLHHQARLARLAAVRVG